MRFTGTKTFIHGLGSASSCEVFLGVENFRRCGRFWVGLDVLRNFVSAGHLSVFAAATTALFVTYDSRGGYREGKRYVYEGGHRVPFMVRWPAGIEQPSRRYDGLVGQVDLLSTVAELIGADLPADAGEDSQSFLSVLKDKTPAHTRLPLINHGNDARYSITDQNWKLILPSKKHDAELYDLATDPAEKNNVLKQHPEIAERLERKTNEIVTRGRTTLGASQPNDTGYWNDLFWLPQEEYENLTSQPISEIRSLNSDLD